MGSNQMNIGCNELQNTKVSCFVITYETNIHDKYGNDYQGSTFIFEAGIITADTLGELFELMAEVMTKVKPYNSPHHCLSGVSVETKFSAIMQVVSFSTHTEDNLLSTYSYAKFEEGQERLKVMEIAEREAQKMNIRTHTEAGEREWLRLLKEKYEPPVSAV